MATAISSQVTHEKERASPRLTLTIPIVIHGKDTRGTSVTEKTQTLVVNQRGTKVLTSHRFPLGASLNVAVPHLKRFSEAKVVWLGPRDTQLQSIGIDLGQGDFWGVETVKTPPATVEESALLVQTAIEQAQSRIQRLVEEAIRQLEGRAAHVLAQSEKTWQQTIQELTQTFLRRQLEASLSEYQELLARTAENVRHELGRKLADLSTLNNG